MSLRDLAQRQWWGGRASGAVPLLLAVLLPLPLLLLADLLHTRGVPLLSSVLWDVNADRSWIEVWGYLLGAAAAVTLGVVGRRRRRGIYASWAVATTVLVLDDALQWHERGAAWLDARLSLPDPPGLRTQDVGELLTWLALGVLVTTLLWAAHRRSPPRARRDSWWLVVLVLFLMLFAVGVDMVHVGLPAVTSSTAVDTAFTWTEAAGELTAMAALLAFAVHVARRQDPPEPRADAPAAPGPRTIDLTSREEQVARSHGPRR